MVIGILILFALIIIYYISTWNTNTNEDYLYGFWIADGDDFCKDSEIDSIMLFIGEPEKSYWTVSRKCHLIIMNDICNQGLTITYKIGWSSPTLTEYTVRIKAEFEEEPMWPEDLLLTIDIRHGTLTIKDDDDVVYAQLQKQHEITNTCNDLE